MQKSSTTYYTIRMHQENAYPQTVMRMNDTTLKQIHITKLSVIICLNWYLNLINENRFSQFLCHDYYHIHRLLLSTAITYHTKNLLMLFNWQNSSKNLHTQSLFHISHDKTLHSVVIPTYFSFFKRIMWLRKSSFQFYNNITQHFSSFFGGYKQYIFLPKHDHLS